jgi:4-alpha-glucanotransferase
LKNFPRESGILLHPTSLPGPYGIGEIGPQARRFVRQLAKMGQQLWQVLPIGPTGYGDSPYQSFSTFAGNTLLISFDQLVRDKLLHPTQLRRFPKFPEHTVDFGRVIPVRKRILRSVCRSFAGRASARRRKAFAAYCEKNAYWLDDYALFTAIKEANDLRPWTHWDSEALAKRDEKALRAARRRFRTAINHERILQYLFDDQWSRLMAYAHNHGVRIIGDIPIFVAHDSADVWANPELYFLDSHGQPTLVAGVPPDYFSATGQLWGNPLYRWNVHRHSDYAWWVARMRKMFHMADLVRIDHFRGFEKYWEIPGHEKTAIPGRWVEGPGADLFHALIRQLGPLPIIAEDLGVITPEVEALRDQFKFPGMRILQFAFGNDPKADDYRPESYPPNCVVYTGTHDNDTTVGWFWSEPGKDSTRTADDVAAVRRRILDYVKTDGREIHWDLIGVALRSQANTVVIPMQDLMGLDSAARMNVPGTLGGNWRWRYREPQLTPAIQSRMRTLAQDTRRAR